MPTVWSHLYLASELTNTSLNFWTVFSFSCLYLYGMGDNDWVDRFKDSLTNPSKPLPSEKIKEKSAKVSLLSLLILAAIGLVQVSQVSQRWALVSCLFFITLYNHFLKSNILLGALAMAGVRMSVIVGFGVSLTAMVVLGIYVMLITLWSSTEEKYPERKKWTLRFLLLLPAFDFILLNLFLEFQKKHLVLLIIPLICWGVIICLRRSQTSKEHPEFIK